MGRKTTQGLVVYIAAESRYSADVRLHALQAHKKQRFNNLAVVDGELDLFSGSKGVEALISAIKEIEATRKQKVVLVIGDTLARLGVGANENAAQDMGLIVRNIDRVRSACETHFCIIHHSGKDANGSRGSTALPAAVDTEIEIGSGKNGSFAKVMKQRDLSSKGNVIGFSLQSVRVGQDQWGEEITTCVVEARDATLDTKPISNKKPTIEDDVLKYLNVQTKFVEKRQVVDAIKVKFRKSACVVYRALASLGNKGLVRSNAQGEVQIV